MHVFIKNLKKCKFYQKKIAKICDIKKNLESGCSSVPGRGGAPRDDGDGATVGWGSSAEAWEQ